MVTFSHGLETFLSVSPSASVDIAHLLSDYLSSKIAPCDLVAYAHAYRAAEAQDLPRLVTVAFANGFSELMEHRRMN